MAFDLSSITTDARLRPPRILLLGVEKIGKSSFAAGADAPIFLPIRGEEGIDDLLVPKFPTCLTLDNVMEALCTLYTTEHPHRTVVIDSASTLEPLVWADTCRRNGNAESIEKVGGGYGKGYIEALTHWRRITEALDALRADRNMASILIGHVKVKRFDDPAGDSYDQYQFDINDKAANLFYRWVDVILFCNTKVVVKKEDVGFNKHHARGIDAYGGARFLYTQKRPAHPGGGRGAYGRLPYELPLNFGSFMDAVAAAASKS
ncbi:MAG: ATP-binding protein [Planctomycetota bacterium]